MPDIRLPPPGDLPDNGGDTKDGVKDTNRKTEKVLDGKDTAAAEVQSQHILKTDCESDSVGDLRYEQLGDGSIMVFDGTGGQGVDDLIIYFDTTAPSTEGDFLI